MNKPSAPTYLGIFCAMLLLLVLTPTDHQTPWAMGLMILATASLYTLLVFLSCRLVHIDRTEGIGACALFLLFFLPGANDFLTKDLDAILELGSQCIVPFFIGQYNKVSQKDFQRIYVLMLLMGIFCSYTHDGITIPLCVGFLWMAIVNRGVFFRTACWPMVIGFVIGTGISIWQSILAGKSDLHPHVSETTMALQILWDTKIFIASTGLTAYLSISKWGRKLLLENYKQHPLLACCAMFSYYTLPFAPLGLDNAVTGVCFFSMYWALILSKALAHKFYYNKYKIH